MIFKFYFCPHLLIVLSFMVLDISLIIGINQSGNQEF